MVYINYFNTKYFFRQLYIILTIKLGRSLGGDQNRDQRYLPCVGVFPISFKVTMYGLGFHPLSFGQYIFYTPSAAVLLPGRSLDTLCGELLLLGALCGVFQAKTAISINGKIFTNKGMTLNYIAWPLVLGLFLTIASNCQRTEKKQHYDRLLLYGDERGERVAA